MDIGERDRVDRENLIVTVGMARYTRYVRHVLRPLGMRVETIDPGFGIDAMRLTAARAEPLGATTVEGDIWAVWIGAGTWATLSTEL